MFTGIIEDVGTVKSVEKRGASGRITIKTALGLKDVREGDSIAVEGVCLTVAGLSKDSFTADLSSETLRVTTLGSLSPGSHVNLEKALTLGKPLGGHLVTGHVDGVGRILSRAAKGEYTDFGFELPAGLEKQVVRKGSIAIDGISLTVVDITGRGFTVAVIPHTLRMTTLSLKKEGDPVNIETDLIGKYVERFLAGKKGVTEDFLSEHGFMK